MSQRMGFRVRKAGWFAVIINVLEFLLILGISIYLIFFSAKGADLALTRFLVTISALLALWGAVSDLQEAMRTVKMVNQLQDMDASHQAVESLNNTLRAQRHDFLNHLQVVYSLMEMREYDEARGYMERVYGDINAVGTVMRTAVPAVNALLRVKMASCRERGIQMELNIHSAWKGLPMPGWVMCRVLSNLIDNAMDALCDTPNPRITLTLREELRTFSCDVANNGPMIDPDALPTLFNAGYTTKLEGHGMGLFIVKETLQEAGGDVTVTSTPVETVFHCWVGKGTGDQPEEAA